MTATAEKKPRSRLKFGCLVRVFESEHYSNHFREARFLGYCGRRCVNVSYTAGGLDVVRRKLVEKI